MIEISLKALAHLQKQLRNTAQYGFVLKVKRSGCSGFKYDLDFLATKPDAKTHTVVENAASLPFYVENSSCAYLKGVKIDFKTEGLQQRLIYINPNETGQCGCGESFSV